MTWLLVKIIQSDITIAPRILNDRGAGIEANYRYLTNTKSENFVDLIFFPKDKEFRKDFANNKDQRWAFRFKENRQLSNFETYIDWSKSSDSMVLLDLPSSITNIANQRDHYLNQTFSANFLSKNPVSINASWHSLSLNTSLVEPLLTFNSFIKLLY